MGDGDLLLRAILARPEEDVPRLALADWLDENGRPERAEFIRRDLAQARRPVTHPDWSREEDWVYAAVSTWGARWYEPCAGSWDHVFGRWLGSPGLDLRIDRGFPWAVWSTPDAWLARADALLERYPIQLVTFRSLPRATRNDFFRRWPRLSFEFPGKSHATPP